MQTEEARSPYRIKRGQLTRRDGPATQIKDPATGEVIRSTRSRAFVHYAAKTPANPNAIDEVELTEREAQAFGLHRLERISRRNIRTVEEVSPTDDDDDNKSTHTKPSPKSAKEKKRAALVNELIEAGEEALGAIAVKRWRNDVINANLLDEVPQRKADILEALRELG